ncbi:MAG TPA: hypothetical protein DIC52_07855 [Candidatus Latescibacteria bacterium]|nr:hypothetical protein [Candidatus Latescibacterota bacterium]|tara:strand:+ start:2987 stop:3964 length:978 start_codon:yes stop_codon:yes gene_type:complete
MKTPSYLSCLLVLVTIWSSGALPTRARVLSFAAGNLTGPRLSTGDSDGDGRVDAALAGMVGESSPMSRSARVDWYATPGGVAIGSEELSVADDLTHADLDGDGRDEIIVLGAHEWHVLKIDDGALRQVATVSGASSFWRITAADIDGDGDDELALVTLHRALIDEVPRAVVELVDVDLSPSGVRLNLLDTWEVAAHIGDLCFAPGAGAPMLIVETGAEEIGGRLHRLATSGGLLRESEVLSMGGERLRILSLSAVAVGPRTLLSLTDVTGRVRIVEWLDGDLRLRGAAPITGSGASLAGSAGNPQMWIAPRRPGEPLRWWSPVEF